MLFPNRLILSLLLAFGLCLDLFVGIGFCTQAAAHEDNHHHCNHGHHHHGHHDHEQSPVERKLSPVARKLPEELAEDEDMKLCGFGHCYHHDLHLEHLLKLSGSGLWLRALGCSLLVSLASLVCLIILPVIFVKGKPSKIVVDSLALFGAGAMLGDAFLHQLPHAFGGGHAPSHDHKHTHSHDHSDEAHHSPSHSHSLEDLSVGISVLAGIVLFLLVEKVVRYVEENSSGSEAWGHGHHHHHKGGEKVKVGGDIRQPDGELIEKTLNGSLSEDTSVKATPLRKRKATGASNDRSDVVAADINTPSDRQEPPRVQSNLVFGYLNLFSDGVHNFTDGMALGSAFLLHGSVGGWSRTVFLLAHELPQEIGDFGILVRSGFSVSKALFFNFLSALVALAGTTLALLWGQDQGQSSLIEGFTAGGFIYIAVAGVIAEMNNTGKITLKSILVHLASLGLGIAVALCISLIE